MKTVFFTSARVREPHCRRHLLQARSMKPVAVSLLALGVAFGACAQARKTEPTPDPGGDFLKGVVADPPAQTQASAPQARGDEVSGGSPRQQGADAAADLDHLEIDLDSSTDADSGNVHNAPASRTDGKPPADGLELAGQEPVALEPGGLVAPSESGEAPNEGEAGDNSTLAAWLDPMRVSLKHENSYKFAAPKRLVNNRSSVRLEYSKPLTSNLYLRLDTKLNLYWSNDHRAKAKDEDFFRELVTREAYLQSSFGNTSFRIGYQILPWGVSEGGAITDEVSPRNSSEFFFISLEESRIGQQMLTMDHFGATGQWSAFFVPKAGYNKYPDRGSEYDIPDSFGKKKPNDSWSDTKKYEYGLRWKRTFGKSDLSLMLASLIDNDYLVRQQRFQMYGFAANIAKDNFLFRTEVALKSPRAYFARPDGSSDLSIVESDQFDSSFGFDYSPGGRPLTYSAEVVWSRLLDWRDDIVGRERDEYQLIGSITNRFFSDDLTLTWLAIYAKPYTSLQQKFLSSYAIDDNSTVYLELFIADERDKRSGSWPYRDQKQIVVRYQYQF